MTSFELDTNSRDRSIISKLLEVEDLVEEVEVLGSDPPTVKFVSFDLDLLESGTDIFHQDCALTTAPISMPNSRNQATRIDI